MHYSPKEVYTAILRSSLQADELKSNQICKTIQDYIYEAECFIRS